VKKTGNYLIIGAGLAGLSFALRASRKSKVTILSKTDIMESNSAKAQGGIAAVQRLPDNYNKHINDTLRVGQGLSNRKMVELMVKNGPQQIKWLIERGVDFSYQGGELDLAREGGHSVSRVVHAGDITGYNVQKTLIEHVRKDPNIRVYENTPVIDLVTEKGKCVGVIALKENIELVEYRANFVVLCTGGVGQLYSKTSNSITATGDGLAMAYRVGAVIRDIEFYQFHPSIFDHGSSPFFLISETVRGEGGVLVNSEGVRFMPRYHALHDLAPRDVVSRAIVEEQKKGNVYLDIRERGRIYLTSRFPNIYNECLKGGYRMDTDLIPVSPAAHYMCGGIKINESGETTISGLLAFGENACSGVHGANRLASNSTLECLTFPFIASETINDYCDDFPEENIVRYSEHAPDLPSPRPQLQEIMWSSYGIIRRKQSMREAEKALKEIRDITEHNFRKSVTLQSIEDRNLGVVAWLLAQAAVNRHESRGTHELEEYPFRDDANWLKHIEFHESELILVDHINV
jgi:L-aspartate oxidase